MLIIIIYLGYPLHRCVFQWGAAKNMYNIVTIQYNTIRWDAMRCDTRQYNLVSFNLVFFQFPWPTAMTMTSHQVRNAWREYCAILKICSIPKIKIIKTQKRSQNLGSVKGLRKPLAVYLISAFLMCQKRSQVVKTSPYGYFGDLGPLNKARSAFAVLLFLLTQQS